MFQVSGTAQGGADRRPLVPRLAMLATGVSVAVTALAGCTGEPAPSVGASPVPVTASTGAATAPASPGSPAPATAGTGGRTRAGGTSDSSRPVSSGRTPTCRAAELVGSTTLRDVAVDPVSANVVLRNTSNRACQLNGYIELMATDDPESVLANVTEPRGPAPTPVVLRPGGEAYASLAHDNDPLECRRYTGLQVVLPGGGGNVALPGRHTLCWGVYVGAVRDTRGPEVPPLR